MRLNVATCGLLASFTSLSVAGPSKDMTQSGSGGNDDVEIKTPGELETLGVIMFADGPGAATFPIDFNENIKTFTVRLKSYEASQDMDNDKFISEISWPPQLLPGTILTCKTLYRMATLGGYANWFTGVGKTGLIVNGTAPEWESQSLYDKAVWLEARWQVSEGKTESSNGIIFAVASTANSTVAQKNVEQARKDMSQLSTTTSEATTMKSTPIITATSTTTAAATANSTPAASGPTPASRADQPGLSTGGKAGIAVGVTLVGLLAAGLLVWLLWFRRRRRGGAGAGGGGGGASAHHRRGLHRRHLPPGMSSYASDGDMHGIMADKEIPVRLGSASRQSAYGGARASTDHYAPYSDTSVAPPSPVPPHAHAHTHTHSHSHSHSHSHLREVTSSEAAVDVPASPGHVDPSQTRGGIGIGIGGGGTVSRPVSTPAPVIASRYAHLVEEGMTAEQVRQLEDEERQLDAAIENAGHRRNGGGGGGGGGGGET
ncbi:putative Kin of IRRE-like protein 3 [Rosellinia necatrix]|uniref:Putative Kin of IRRE-like protein 3 n=1 Tax=Rosellinia necatrix TaxID=77044 RepID=A0A1W2TBB9_ROSNE|nr:putative Kin of IRRE-like protein 3 [Rosellinia necatrix]